jgi:drug/metabolite transporter (DMT)-like permease
VRPAHRNPLAHPFALLTLVALFWAGNVVLGRAVPGRIPPVTLNSLRWAIALAVVLPFAWPQLAGMARIVRAHMVQLAMLAIPCVAIYNSLLYAGARTTTATNAGVIVGMMPIMIVVFAGLLGQERVTWRRAAGLAVSFAGVVCVICKGHLDFIRDLSCTPGNLMILGAATAWGIYTALLRRFALPLGSFALLALLSAIGLAVSLPFCAWEFMAGARVEWSIGTAAAVLYVGVFPSVIALVLWNRAVAEVGAGTAGLFTNLIPVFSLLLAVVLLGETVERFQLIGMGLIFAGIRLATMRAPASSRDSLPAAEPRAMLAR